MSATRQQAAVRRERIVDVAGLLFVSGESAARCQKGLATMAGVMGAHTRARAVDDQQLSDEILDTAGSAFARWRRA